tara:strand:+ start:998 stop:1381 length:384 start_codon:yes stop_codon:yes gene_type:complete
MNRKIEVIKKFNNILKSLLLQLSSIIGKKYFNKFCKIIKYNSIMPINYWSENCLDFKDQIMRRDEEYFIKRDIKKNNFKENDISEILKLKCIYSKVDNESKKNIWSYLQVLMVITEEYNKLKIINHY